MKAGSKTASAGLRKLDMQNELVGEKGLEPSRLATLAPKASVSTNSTTRP